MLWLRGRVEDTEAKGHHDGEDSERGEEKPERAEPGWEGLEARVHDPCQRKTRNDADKTRLDGHAETRPGNERGKHTGDEAQGGGGLTGVNSKAPSDTT